MPLLYPDVNGHRTSYCSIELGVNGVLIKGAKSINYKEEVEDADVYGNSANQIGGTRGKAKCSGDIEFLEAEWNQLILPVITLGGVIGYAERRWLITVTYAEAANMDLTVTDILEGVKFKSIDRSNGEGVDALTVKVSLGIMAIKWRGVFRALRAPTDIPIL
jgi:hypothetical protein